MSTKRFRLLRAFGVSLVAILVAPFVLFLGVLTLPALLFFAPVFALFEAGEATAHELERREDERQLHAVAPAR